MPNSSVSDRTVPYNLETERAILGSILLDTSCLASVVKVLTRDDFFSGAHRITFETMLTMSESFQGIDLVTLTEELSKRGLVEQAGGAAYLAGLTDGVPLGTTAGVAEYIRIVKEKSKLRVLLNTSNNLISRILKGTEDSESLLSDFSDKIQDLRLIDGKVKNNGTGETTVVVKSDPKAKPRSKVENYYPMIEKEAWHPAADLYRRAHDQCTEGSDNWHFITFYTVVGSMLGRTVGTRMGGMIFGNLYSVLVGQIGGDGKDTVADFGTDFIQMIDPSLYIPESIDSKPGFCKEWQEYNNRQQILTNHRALLRLPEIRSYLDTAEQSGTKSISPMLLTHYSPRRALDNSSIATNVHIVDPHLAMLACGAKRFIGQIPEVDLINGLGRRICFVPGDPKGPNPDPEAPDMNILVPLADSLKSSIEVYQERKHCNLQFSPDAKKLWKDWYKTYWKRKRGDDLLAALNNGDRVTCRKIALINAALDKSQTFIEANHLRPAMAFTEFLYECRYPIFSEHGANPYVEIEKKIMEKIPDYPTRILKRWVQRYLRSIDSKTFNDRIRYMTMDDGPLQRKIEGRKIWLWRSEP